VPTLALDSLTLETAALAPSERTEIDGVAHVSAVAEATIDEPDDAPTRQFVREEHMVDEDRHPDYRGKTLSLSDHAPDLFMPSAIPPRAAAIAPEAPRRAPIETADAFEPPPSSEEPFEPTEGVWRPNTDRPSALGPLDGRPRARSFEEGQFTGTPHHDVRTWSKRSKDTKPFAETSFDAAFNRGFGRKMPLFVALGLAAMILLAGAVFLARR
jgi:hypothetical protein